MCQGGVESSTYTQTFLLVTGLTKMLLKMDMHVALLDDYHLLGVSAAAVFMHGDYKIITYLVQCA